MKVPFNKPSIVGREIEFIEKAVALGKIAGDGYFTKQCSAFFESRYGFKKVLLTTSCTSALEMAALLLNIQPGDEVIMPSYTFVSTANTFILRGAKIVFADSGTDSPNIDAAGLERLVTKKTKAIVVVHYAGVACQMDKILALARRHGLRVIEDAAHAPDSFYKGKPLGSLGHMAAFSFHETKNVSAGEGGMLVINDDSFIERAEIIREKGTNKVQFLRGEIDRYEWVDIGSSYLISDINAAFLYGQLQKLKAVQKKRKAIWQRYYKALLPLHRAGAITLAQIPAYATNNAHIFYFLCNSLQQRDKLIKYLKEKGIQAPFHYQTLHNSAYYLNKHGGKKLPNCERYAATLIRLPVFYELSAGQQQLVIEGVKSFFAI